jgi:pimeloyl-ACP methyl ester carboxylesterase
MDTALFQQPRRRRIQLADGEMAVLDFGDEQRAPDVIFSHANGFNAATYRQLLGPLSLGLRVIACDLRGHGDSQLPADPGRLRRSWSEFRDDLIGLVEAVAEGPVVLAGHSLGASVSLLAAAKRPALARSLVLAEPVILPYAALLSAYLPWGAGVLWKTRFPLAAGAARRRAVFKAADEAFNSYKGRGGFKTWPDAVLADYVSGAFHARADGQVELACPPDWEASNFAAQANDVRGALRRVRVPVGVLKAEHHSTCALSPADVRRMNPKARCAIVPGTSHFLPMERPDLVREALLDAVGV